MDLANVTLKPYVDYEVGNIITIKGKYGFRVCVKFDDLSEKECQHSGFVKKSEAEKARDTIWPASYFTFQPVYKKFLHFNVFIYYMQIPT